MQANYMQIKSLQWQDQQGFTLVELMIALVLGLLVSAAAIRFFLTGAQSYRVQQAATDVQDAEVFSMDYIQKEIAMANLGAYRPMTQQSAWTGVVFTNSVASSSATATTQVGNLRGLSGLNDNNVTKDSSGSSNLTGLSSDQLVLTYKAPFAMQNCEGENVAKDTMVIEKFYVAQDTAQSSAESADPSHLALALYCDAGSFTLANGTDPDNVTANSLGAITGLDGVGHILINRVDAFKVKIGTQAVGSNNITYRTISNYAPTTGTYAVTDPIVSIQLGVISRASNAISSTVPNSFSLFGSNYTLATQTPSYIRRVYESTTRLRNNGISQ